jgi:hypothetical protein
MAQFDLDAKDIQKLVQIASQMVNKKGFDISFKKTKGLVVSLKEKGSLSVAPMSCEGSLSIKTTDFEYSVLFDGKEVKVTVS